jgi:uncharacterized protein
MRPGPLAATALVLALATGCSGGEVAAPVTSAPPPMTSSASPKRNTPPTPSKPTPTPEPTTAIPKPGPDVQKRLDEQLIRAAWADDVKRARALIARGADVNAKDDTVQSAYLISTSEGSLDLLNLMLKHGGDIAAKDSFNGTGLIRAADRGLADVAGRLVQAGVDVDHVNNLGWTALHEAIILGDGSRRYVDTVRVLVAAGADVTLRSRRDGVSPLDHARAKDHDEIAAVLSAALDADRTGQAADQRLLAAAADGDATAAALALRAGANIETRDDRRRTPLLRAVAAEHQAVARLLSYLGADPTP